MSNIINRINFWLVFFTGFLCGVAQQNNPHIVFGDVKDNITKQSVFYANIVVIDKESKKIEKGTVSDDKGSFSLETSLLDFYVEISFIGYKTQIIENIDLSKSNINLGTIFLEQDNQQLEAVEIRAEKSKTEFKLDKKVFNVGKDIASTGVSALEVLNNVPSVNVNIEGEVSLRGSSGVQILIDGKPSILSDDSSNALGTITADMIKSIEVVTNPSAKYDAEGTAGVLNIVLKKEEKKGFNGSVSLNTGIPDNHSIGISLNRRTQKFNFFTQFGVGYRSIPKYNQNITRDKENGTELKVDGDNFRNENFYNIVLGTDYHIDDYNVVTLSGNFAYEIEDVPSDFNYNYWVTDVLENDWDRVGVTNATNPKWRYDLSYKKEFKNNKEHVLQASALGRFFGKDIESEFTHTDNFGTNSETNQQTETEFQLADYTFKLDYTNPITENFVIEAGSQYIINNVGNDYEVRDFNEESYVVNENLTNNFEFVQKVLGVYGTLGYEIKKWGIKAGLRLETTDLTTFLENTDVENKQNYTDLFPSIHTSYKLKKDFSVQAGYSTRIYRPRLWDLNPFFNIQDSYNIRSGNPSLLPEYTDSYELTTIYKLGKASMSSSLYYRYTTAVREKISIFDGEVRIRTPFNIGTNATTGFETNGKFTPVKWLTLNGDFNWYSFDRKGEYEDQNFDFSGDRWTSRLSAKVNLPLDIDFEITGNYRSSYKTLQGQISDFGFADLGIRKKIFKGKAVVNFAVRDVFNSRIYENIIDNDTNYQYSFSQKGTFFTLGFSYGFGKGEAMTYSGRRRR